MKVFVTEFYTFGIPFYKGFSWSLVEKFHKFDKK